MKMSVREARAHFAAAIEAAERGERVTITRNGEAVAELGPVQKPSKEGFWERTERVRKEMGLDKIKPARPLDEKWLEEFNDAAWTRELFGPDYYDDEPGPA